MTGDPSTPGYYFSYYWNARASLFPRFSLCHWASLCSVLHYQFHPRCCVTWQWVSQFLDSPRLRPRLTCFKARCLLRIGHSHTISHAIGSQPRFPHAFASEKKENLSLFLKWFRCDLSADLEDLLERQRQQGGGAGVSKIKTMKEAHIPL